MTSLQDVVSGVRTPAGWSRTGAPRIRATISITRAAASPHLRLHCLSMSCVLATNAVARTDF
jgi:hypothetical protein